MSNHQVIVPKGMEYILEKIRYAPAVRAGNMLFVSGQIGRDEHMQLVGDKKPQFIQVFDNLKKILDASGCTFDDVVDVTSFHTDMRDLPLYMEVRDKYFTRTCPAWTAIGASMLGGAPGYMLEVKVIAVVSLQVSLSNA
ncbi:MAG: RidA family protein [Rhodocyclaceae bacterium]|nr:MAG: RidA family protein [Rhodocyclaceae bacterium]